MNSYNSIGKKQLKIRQRNGTDIFKRQTDMVYVHYSITYNIWDMEKT